jgi:hypothetical protein
MVSLLCVVEPGPASAQTKPFDDPTGLVTQPSERDIGFKSGSLIAAPVPFENPSLGTGLALGVGYLFQSDSLSDTSSLGAAGFRTSNGSYGYGLGLDLSWDSGRWTARVLAAEADLNYDLYAFDRKVPINQSLTGARLQLGHSPRTSFTFGGSLDYGKYTLSLPFDRVLPAEFRPDIRLTIARLGAFAQ